MHRMLECPNCSEQLGRRNGCPLPQFHSGGLCLRPCFKRGSHLHCGASSASRRTCVCHPLVCCRLWRLWASLSSLWPRHFNPLHSTFDSDLLAMPQHINRSAFNMRKFGLNRSPPFRHYFRVCSLCSIVILAFFAALLLFWVSMGDELREYSPEEVALHNSASSAWMIYDGFVLDLTTFLSEHPGGDEVIMEVSGKDGTAAFRDVGHSDDAKEMTKDYIIGRVTKGTSSDDFEKWEKRRRWCIYAGISTAVVIVGLIFAYKYVKKFRPR